MAGKDKERLEGNVFDAGGDALTFVVLCGE